MPLTLVSDEPPTPRLLNAEVQKSLSPFSTQVEASISISASAVVLSLCGGRKVFLLCDTDTLQRMEPTDLKSFNGLTHEGLGD